MNVRNGVIGAVLGLVMFGNNLSHAQTVSTDATYQNAVVNIPFVDSVEQVGFIQNAKLQQTALGDWRLVEYKAEGQPLNAKLLGLAGVNSVTLVVTESFPVQVFLKVQGEVGGCTVVGQAPQRRSDSTFEIVIYKEDPNPKDSVLIGCAAVQRPFTKVVPLAVYGLSAGTYQYRLKGLSMESIPAASVNGVPTGALAGVIGPKFFIGSFVLSKDNSL